MSQLGSEPDFFKDLNAVAPEGVCAFAECDFADALFDIGGDRRVPDEVAVDEKVEAVHVIAARCGLDHDLVTGNFVVLGEFAKGDAWQGGFHLGGAFVEGAAVAAVALRKLALREDAATFHFEGFHGDRSVAVAADDVFRDAVCGVALTRLGDSVFCDAHH